MRHPARSYRRPPSSFLLTTTSKSLLLLLLCVAISLIRMVETVTIIMNGATKILDKRAIASSDIGKAYKGKAYKGKVYKGKGKVGDDGKGKSKLDIFRVKQLIRDEQVLIIMSFIISFMISIFVSVLLFRQAAATTRTWATRATRKKHISIRTDKALTIAHHRYGY